MTKVQDLLDKVNKQQREDFLAAWGNVALVVNEDEIAMPDLPEGYEWMVTREVTGTHPTYRVALTHCNYQYGGEHFRVAQRGLIDKTMYGEAGVRELAQRLLEKELG